MPAIYVYLTIVLHSYNRSEKRLRSVLASVGKADVEAEAAQKEDDTDDGSSRGSDNDSAFDNGEAGAVSRVLDEEDENGDVDW